MKYLYLILLPLLVFAQDVDKFEPESSTDVSCDWLIDGKQGIVLEIHRDAMNFDEQLMYFDPSGVAVSSNEGNKISLNELEAPFMAEIVCYGTGGRTYVKSVRFLKQFSYDATGYIIE